MKKTRLNFLLRFIFIFSFSVVLINCAADEDNLTSDTEATDNLLDGRTADQNLRPNRMEYIGIEHNIFMAEFTKQLEDSYNSRNWDGVNFLSKNYKTQFSRVINDAYRIRYTQSTSTVDYQEGIYTQLDLDEWFDGDNTTVINLASNVLNSKATTRDRDFTMNLLIELFSAAQQATSNDEAYRAIEEVVNRHERLILAVDWGDKEDYALGAIAVAKYSAQYWKNYDFSVYARSGATNRDGEINPRSGIIVGADTAGYVVGGVVGGTGGSFAGPAGTVGGVLGGKAAGAWTGSAVAATAITIYDAFVDFFD